MAWLQQQLTRERPDTFMQLESSSAMSRTLARTGRTIHFLSHEILQRGIVEHGVGQKPLQPRLPVLQRLQSPSLGNIHPAEAGLPVVD